MCGTRPLLVGEPSEGIAPIFAQQMAELLDDLKWKAHRCWWPSPTTPTAPACWTRTYIIKRGSIAEAGSSRYEDRRAGSRFRQSRRTPATISACLPRSIASWRPGIQ